MEGNIARLGVTRLSMLVFFDFGRHCRVDSPAGNRDWPGSSRSHSAAVPFTIIINKHPRLLSTALHFQPEDSQLPLSTVSIDNLLQNFVEQTAPYFHTSTKPISKVNLWQKL